MARKLLHKDPTFKDLINIVASEMGINPYLVEKDYWIMHTLYGLQKQNFEFELKGGTSLSKGYKISDKKDFDLLNANYQSTENLYYQGQPDFKLILKRITQFSSSF